MGLMLLGDDAIVPLVTGKAERYRNFDYAASTSPLLTVHAAVQEFLPWYGSVHRGAGFKSQVSTAAYEGARSAVRAFLHPSLDHAILFTRNTTDSMNLLARALPPGIEVLAFATEHHANLLPWKRGQVRYLSVPPHPEETVAQLDAELSRSQIGLVAVTGASNVTGEVWPIAELVSVAHRHGARVVLDAAQLAPHFPIDMQALQVDYLAFSGHKLYSPYGVGVLVGKRDWLDRALPYLYGGGAVDFVTLGSVCWSGLPERHEAGSPNVIGAVALGAACDALVAYGMARLAEEELELATHLRRRLSAVDGIETYDLWGAQVPRLGIVALNLRGISYQLLATILSAEYGIGVRHGCFCAHPLMQQLLRCSEDTVRRLEDQVLEGRRDSIPGAVRVSIGVGTSREDIDYLADALERIALGGAEWTYRVDGGDYLPDPDPRAWPTLDIKVHRERAVDG